MRTTIGITLALAGLVPAALCAQTTRRLAGKSTSPRHQQCAPDNGGLTLPTGFCATVFADSVLGARHIAVAPNGDVFVASQGGGGGATGGVFALRDTKGTGRADERKKFGSFSSSEVALYDGYLYTETTTSVIRYRLPRGALEPAGEPDTVVRDLPGMGHRYKTFVIGRDGALYVNVGSRTNVCQEKDRAAETPGQDPCPELDTRAGIWKFDAKKLGQTQSTGEHFARGIRNSVGITINPADNGVYVMQHGRDQLSLWPKLYNDTLNAESPGEELFHVQAGDDFGWPYCYFDRAAMKKLLAPEYGGDARTAGRCSDKKGNVASFPGHWAPNGLLFYTGSMFPARYREGAFVAFHGSWNRAPLPQAGYNVVFQPLRNGRAAGDYQVFADGFRPASGGPGTHRPVGLAQGPDGALYVTDDAGGRIWKVVYTGAR
jgi:glucose/arabinose dehydrogenase